MDELINILVFVVTIVIFIVSAIRKSNKQPGKSNNKSKVDLESLFGIQVEEPITVETEKPKEVVVKEKPMVDKKARIEKKTKLGGINNIPNPIKETEIKENVDNEPEFNLQSAIIYTEILKRKNF